MADTNQTTPSATPQLVCPFDAAYTAARRLRALLALNSMVRMEGLRNVNDELQDDLVFAAEEFANQLVDALDRVVDEGITLAGAKPVAA